MDEAAKIYRYANDVLPAMDINELMDALVTAEMANQNADGRQYQTMDRQIGLIRDEIRYRVK